MSGSQPSTRFRLEDARQWLNAKFFGDVPHPKTGATALHVASAKGYTKVKAFVERAEFESWPQSYEWFTTIHRIDACWYPLDPDYLSSIGALVPCLKNRILKNCQTSNSFGATFSNKPQLKLGFRLASLFNSCHLSENISV